ncbi:unnamed protein product [Withania somnifera]
MEISFFSGAVTFICCVFSVAAVFLTRRSKSESVPENGGEDSCNCETKALLNGESNSSSSSGGGVEGEMVEKVPGSVAVEKHAGASMMEQLVPEITTHALSYLDYPSLCRLSMTNSLMRKAANDDNAWKALYHKVYNAVIGSWQMAFNWEQNVDLEIRDVKARVMTDSAWVTMKAYLNNMGSGNVTNVFEFNNGRWYTVHHHCSVMLIHGGAGQQVVQG